MFWREHFLFFLSLTQFFTGLKEAHEDRELIHLTFLLFLNN